MADITDLLRRWSDGDQQAFDEMTPLIYSDLKRLAANSLRHERRQPSLNCTALVHEAYLRLVKQDQMDWKDRRHFFGAAAGVMRRILVDEARQRLAGKRGSGAEHQPLDDSIRVALEPDLDVLALHEALAQLETADPESARVVELRCFGGLSIDEAADVLGTSPATVTRAWTFARAWLFRRLRPDETES